jgi:hypothetical protein
MLEFEAMNIPCRRTELSAQYVDHNLLQLEMVLKGSLINFVK